MCILSKASGVGVILWIFIFTPIVFLKPAYTQSFPADGKYWGTTKMYSLPPGVMRILCSKCGANVFWNANEELFGRTELLGVAVSLIDAPSGARAEEMLEWCGRVSFRNNAMQRV
jgi:hypothetical protein